MFVTFVILDDDMRRVVNSTEVVVRVVVFVTVELVPRVAKTVAPMITAATTTAAARVVLDRTRWSMA